MGQGDHKINVTDPRLRPLVMGLTDGSTPNPLEITTRLSEGTIRIDWGDGGFDIVDASEQTTDHTYDDVENGYVVQISPEQDVWLLDLAVEGLILSYPPMLGRVGNTENLVLLDCSFPENTYYPQPVAACLLFAVNNCGLVGSFPNVGGMGLLKTLNVSDNSFTSLGTEQASVGIDFPKGITSLSCTNSITNRVVMAGVLDALVRSGARDGVADLSGGYELLTDGDDNDLFILWATLVNRGWAISMEGHEQVLTNPGFTTGDFTGWTNTGSAWSIIDEQAILPASSGTAAALAQGSVLVDTEDYIWVVELNSNPIDGFKLTDQTTTDDTTVDGVGVFVVPFTAAGTTFGMIPDGDPRVSDSVVETCACFKLEIIP